MANISKNLTDRVTDKVYIVLNHHRPYITAGGGKVTGVSTAATAKLCIAGNKVSRFPSDGTLQQLSRKP